MAKALSTIVRLSELTPEQACYCNAWGEVLVHLSLCKEGVDDAETVSLVRMATGRFAQAILLSSGQENLSWLANYGRACDDLGKLTAEVAEHEKAALFLSQVYEKDPEFEEISTDFAYNQLHLGVLSASLEPIRHAVALFDFSLGRDPECCRSLVGMGRALLELAVESDEPHAPQERGELLAKAERFFGSSV